MLIEIHTLVHRGVILAVVVMGRYNQNPWQAAITGKTMMHIYFLIIAIRK